MRPAGLPLLLVLVLAACGGGDEGDSAPPPAAAASPDDEGGAAPPAAAPRPAAARPQQVQVSPEDTAGMTGDSTQLQREIFSYRGAGRDPFLSLLRSADTRPLVTDIRVIAITFDARYPVRSVAVLGDTAQKKRYTVRTGDELGRMKVAEIRSDQVVVTLDEFGVERQVVLQVRRREETP
jgi:hypothetical protein